MPPPAAVPSPEPVWVLPPVLLPPVVAGAVLGASRLYAARCSAASSCASSSSLPLSSVTCSRTTWDDAILPQRVGHSAEGARSDLQAERQAKSRATTSRRMVLTPSSCTFPPSDFEKGNLLMTREQRHRIDCDFQGDSGSKHSKPSSMQTLNPGLGSPAKLRLARSSSTGQVSGVCC